MKSRKLAGGIISASSHNSTSRSACERGTRMVDRGEEEEVNSSRVRCAADVDDDDVMVV